MTTADATFYTCTAFMETSVADRRCLSGTSPDPEWRREWDRVINDCLIEWAKNPDNLRRPDFDPPTRSAVNTACNLALQLKDCSPVPAVLPDGGGGICFEWRKGDYSASINIYPDGHDELVEFSDGRLVRR